MKNLKKLLFTFIISVLVLVPVITNAETINVKTMEELLNAVKGNNTVVLDDNITLNKALEINGNNVVLDLNGKTITITEKYIDLIKGSLEITGKGTIKDTRVLEAPGSTIYVEGSTNKSDTGYSTLYVGKDITIDTTQWGLSVWDTSAKAYGVTVNFDGTIVSTGSKAGGITIQGNIKNDGTAINVPVINLSKTTKITATGSDGFPLYGAGAGQWNVVEATCEGINGALGVKSGRFNIVNATLKATGKPGVAEGYGNGINGVGAAIQIESNNTYFGKIELLITQNSQIISEKGNSIYHYSAQTGVNNLNELRIHDGNFVGDIVFQENDKVYVKGGTFQTDSIGNYVENGYKLIKLSETKYTVSNINYIDVEGASATVTVDGKETKYASIEAGIKVKVNAKADTGYYVKEIIVKDSKDNKITVTNNEFTMPEGAVTISLDTARCLDKDANIVEVAKDITVSDKVNGDKAKEILDIKLDNRNSGLVKSINKEKLQLIDTTTIIEVNFNTKLVEYDEKTNKVVYEIKPMYSINGIDYTEIPNEALNGGKIRINLPIPSSVKDTHAKVKHINNDKVIDEKEYEIKKTEDGKKYITIETTSFSTFEISYFTAKNLNPQTGDNVMTYVIMLLGSMLTIVTVVLLKKRFN
ncbi:putative uncharacterized protein [Clostridium sp. CAG:524]|nr:putative uncharacterized protein [Clostridium sp. CAG:524]